MCYTLHAKHSIILRVGGLNVDIFTWLMVVGNLMLASVSGIER